MKIICVGCNYVAHVNEFNKIIPEEPVLFMKPDSALLRNNDPFYIPDWSNEVHYEVELIVKINRLGKNIEKKFAHRYYSEVGLGVDFTARDVQRALMAKGLPWEKSKAFDHSAVICPNFFPVDTFADRNTLHFWLNKNGETAQQGDTSKMIFSVDDIVAYASNYFTLKIGDLIYTGTPSGVGPVAVGDRLEGYLEGVKAFDFLVK